MMMVTKRGVIHSQEEKGVQDVLISIGADENGIYKAKVGNKICTAIYNVFVGHYYVDDIYGVLREKEE